MSKSKQNQKGEGEQWLGYLMEGMDKDVNVGTSFRAVGRTFVFIIWIWIKAIRGLFRMVFRRKKNDGGEPKEIVLPEPQQVVPPYIQPRQRSVQSIPQQQVVQQPQVQQYPLPPLPPTSMTPPTDDLFSQVNDAFNDMVNDVNEAFKSVGEELKEIRLEIEKLYTMVGVRAGVQPPTQKRIIFHK